MTPVERRRIFWLVCCTLSWCATGLVVMASWNAFQNNAISFVVETTYLDWNTDFPSLTVCDTSSEKRKSREYANKTVLDCAKLLGSEGKIVTHRGSGRMFSMVTEDVTPAVQEHSALIPIATKSDLKVTPRSIYNAKLSQERWKGNRRRGEEGKLNGVSVSLLQLWTPDILVAGR
uniref:Uncharacterized protein n=1 Tax=Timema poppense TaxID=170557 RepID=A0A7R9DJH8_TIMPO|nr:unnamed protein product [Timema poppensis]